MDFQHNLSKPRGKYECLFVQYYVLVLILCCNIYTAAIKLYIN